MLDWEKLKQVQDGFLQASRNTLKTGDFKPGCVMFTKDIAAARGLGFDIETLPGLDGEEFVAMSLQFSNGELFNAYMSDGANELEKITLFNVLRVVQQQHSENGKVRAPHNGKESEAWFKEGLDLYQETMGRTRNDLEDAIIKGVMTKLKPYATLRLGVAVQRRCENREEYDRVRSQPIDINTLTQTGAQECVLILLRSEERERVLSLGFKRDGHSCNFSESAEEHERVCTAGLSATPSRAHVDPDEAIAGAAERV